MLNISTLFKEVDDETRKNLDFQRRIESVKKEYAGLRKLKVAELRRIWSQNRRVGDPKELDKQRAIYNILKDKYGERAVSKALDG